MSAVSRLLANSLQPIQSRDTELSLIARTQAGDREAGDILWRSYSRHVVKTARSFAISRGFAPTITFDDDVMAEGALWFLEAVRTFNSEKAAKGGLATHCILYVHQGVREHYQAESMVLSLYGGGSVAAQKIRKGYRKVSQAIKEAGASHASIVEAAEILDVDGKDLSAYLAGQRNRSISFDAPVGEDVFLGDVIPSKEAPVDERLGEEQETSHRSAMLRAALARLPERYREVLMRRRLVDEPDTLEAIGQRFGVSRERVRQIENNAMKKLTAFMCEAHSAELATDGNF